MPSIPRLVNRGPAGLLKRITEGTRVTLGGDQRPAVAAINYSGSINRISPNLVPLAVDIDSVMLDSENARLHPERNMEAIKQSLTLYGQTVALVAQRSSRKIVAGNGRWQAAKEMGWTKIAVNMMELTDIEAAGYGLADNRTAELADWDFKVVDRLDRLLQESSQPNVGWSQDELLVLRALDLAEAQTEESALEQLEESIEQESVPERLAGDAELLMKLQVTLDEPQTKVSLGQVYIIGKHVLVVADVVTDCKQWRQLLTDDMLFCPYPGPLLLLTDRAISADQQSMLLVQPDPYIAGHILDNYKSIYGDEGVSIVE